MKKKLTPRSRLEQEIKEAYNDFYAKIYFADDLRPAAKARQHIKDLEKKLKELTQ